MSERAMVRAVVPIKGGDGAKRRLSPALSPLEVERVVAEHQSGADFVIVPAHDLVGTNAVLCAPPDRVALRFGGRSFDGHLRAARRAGIEPRVLRLPGIELDLDRPADLDRFMAAPSETRAWRLLREAGLTGPAGREDIRLRGQRPLSGPSRHRAG